MNETLVQRMEEMDLSFMAAGLETFLIKKGRNEQSTTELIAELLDLERLPRKERMTKTRLKLSRMPRIKLLEDFDRVWLKGGLTERDFKDLSSLAFIERKENVIFMGPSGVGKTHLLLGLGRKACMNGYSAYYMSCQDLMEILIKAKNHNSIKNKLRWFKKPHVLLIDEIGYENLLPEQATLFFQLISTRYESGSIILTTNRPFAQWGTLLADDAIATATIDRLLHHALIFSMKGESYRMKDRLKPEVVDFV